MKTKLTEEQKQANRLAKQKAKREAKELAIIEAEKNQEPIKSVLITIEWRKSRMWRSNPHATAEVIYKGTGGGENGTGFVRKDGFTCSGCGYDKESTVIGEIFNEFLKYKLWQLSDNAIRGGNGSLDNGKAPYGIHLSNDKKKRYYGQGIGTNCYYRIAEYIGGKFECVASGKTFDVYKYTED